MDSLGASLVEAGFEIDAVGLEREHANALVLDESTEIGHEGFDHEDPVVGEPLGEPGVYGEDRLFVAIGEHDGVATLENLGHPVVRLAYEDREQIGGEYFRWEMATAVAGYVLQINPFDQPNVEEAKAATREILAGGAVHGAGFDDLEPLLERVGEAGRAVDVGADAGLLRPVALRAQPPGHQAERAVAGHEAGDQQDGVARAAGDAEAAEDLGLARTVAERSGARALLSGTLSRIGATLHLSAALTELPSDLRYAEVALIAAMSFLISLLATLYPSWRASKTQPAEALRYE